MSDDEFQQCDCCHEVFWHWTDLNDYNGDQLCNDCIEKAIADKRRDEMKDDKMERIE